jgi:N-acyl-D-amino-acid deacylase
VLETIEKARGEGLTVTHDQYAYTASSTGLGQTVPDWFKEGGRDKFLERFNTPELKAKAMQEMRESLAKRKSPDFSYAFIASYRHDPSYNGFNVVEAARQMWGGESIDDQIETILEIEKTGGASAVFHSMSDADLETFMKHSKTMFASDSGVRRFKKDVPHPRGYGNNARVLGHYVREKKVISLEDAIRKMAALPAETFKLKDRGELRPGYWADVVVFDPATVTDPATFKDPHHYSTGFRYVLVNGVAVVENDQHTGARPGKMLRKELPREQVAGGG